MKLVRLSAIVTALFLCISAMAATPKGRSPLRDGSYYQHFIFFGDSFTDTGNYPEPANVVFPTLKNFNLYVPISNPVPSALYGKGGVPGIHFLQQSIPSQGKINGKKRRLYSINWPLYLVYNSNPDNVLLPWVQHYIAPEKKVDSINYAWASALASGQASYKDCFHDDGETFSGICSANTLIERRNLYLRHTANNPSYDKQHKYTYADLKIPNLAEQVSLYLNDSGVRVKNNTAFFIYIGGNDIGNYLKSKLFQAILFPASFFDKKIDKKMALVASDVAAAASKVEKAYSGKHFNYKIYVLTLPSLANLHEGYTYTHIPIVGGKIEKTLDYTVAEYNRALHSVFEDNPHVQIIDVGQYIDTLATKEHYKHAIEKGLTCIEDPSGDYVTPDRSVNANCNYHSSQGTGAYFSWNNVHFISKVNQQVAWFVLKAMR